MIRLHPTPIVPSDDEISSCVQRILFARILERGTDRLVSSLERRQSSSEAASLGSSYLAPDSSSFEAFPDCGPDDYSSSSTLSTGKRKREDSPRDPLLEQSPTFPPPQEPPPSSTDAELAEELDIITLNFTTFLSPSTWLGPFAASSGSVARHTYQGWADDIPAALCCQMKSLYTPIPKGFSSLQYLGRYSDTSQCSAESSKVPSALGFTVPLPISPESARWNSPCHEPTPPTPQLPDSHYTDSESEEGFILSDSGSSSKF
ncbi:hypothetical protein AJ78_03119 [Emergomyces pasteurianus Ep9510]|uniref:Uncharacterized protein n=1 Tax=Emergomyces pasteurianus Ep9510 TaxID=1447872 RepID=A0A1J9QLH6_9EURO|nr:hypothetical protein AJ78_03119 [Emergomyces pasteurianus Ep9510]